MAEIIFDNEPEFAKYMDDMLEKDFDDYDYDPDMAPSQKDLDHAASVVGKYCTCPEGCTPSLKNVLCKVIAVNTEERGGDASQVRVIMFKNNEMWDPKLWMLIPMGERYEVYGGWWMEPTDARPTMVDRIVGWTSYIARITFSEIGREKTAFHYKWWKDFDARSHAPVCSILGALYDTVLAFKYGVSINQY
jgi:hypothetical protein